MSTTPDQTRYPGTVSVRKASQLLGLPEHNLATLFRILLKRRIEYVLTADERILVNEDSIAKYLEAQNAEK